MKPHEQRLYAWSVWSLGVFMLASGGALLIVMLANVIGPFRFGAIDPSQASQALGFWLPVDGVRPFPPEIARRTEAWRRLVDREDVVIESARLRELLGAGVGAVVLPDARQLTDEQTAALDRYMMDGGGIVVTGSIGVRDETGAWIGYERMRTLLRAESIHPLDEEESELIAAHHRGPISAGLRPALRFRVLGEPGVPALAGRDGELLWARASGDHAVASHRVRLGRGRLAWMGPGPEVVYGAEEEDRRALDEALVHALAWVRKAPVLETLPWPGEARFALTIEKRQAVDEAPDSPAAWRALEQALLASVDAAAESGEHVRIEIPVRGAGDLEGEAVRISLLERARGLGAWLATLEEATAWTTARAGMRVKMTDTGPKRLLVDVTYEGAGELVGAGLRLWINRPAGSVEVSAVNLGQALPAVRFDRATESADLLLPALDAGSTLSFHLDFDVPDYDGSADVRSG